MERTRAEWEDVLPYRLDDVYESVIRSDHPVTILRDLRSFGRISEYYDEICLAVDVWHLFDRRPIYAHRRFAETSFMGDAYIRIFFGIVVQAICDAKMGRPCDAHSWRLDHPPGDGQPCTPTTHLCKKNAVEFIVENDKVWEEILNLPYGTLVELMTKKNDSLRSRSQEIFNCIGQGS